VELGAVGTIWVMGFGRVAFIMACVVYEGLDAWDGVYTGQTDFEMGMG
jgi:hypothetical protein